MKILHNEILPCDPTAVKVVVRDVDVGVLVGAQLEEAVVADVCEDVPLDHHVGAGGHEQPRHGGVRELGVHHSDGWGIKIFQKYFKKKKF